MTCNSNLMIVARRILAVSLLALGCTGAVAAPGAHGPNGEHLDAPVTTQQASAAPRLELQSELYELVGVLGGGEFSMLIDRFATNEPLRKGKVQLESGSLKADAKLHDDIGDFSIDDPAMLKLLSSPGEHPVVVTIMNGDESDLLTGTLVVKGGNSEAHGHGFLEENRVWLVAGVLVLILILAWAARRRRGSRALFNGVKP